MPTKKDLPEGLVRAIALRPSGVDSRELLEELTRVWGGPGQLALSIHQEFQGSAKGGMTRQRILEMIQRLIINNTEHELTSKVRAVDMPTEDLERFAAAYIQRMLEKNGGK